MIKLSVKEKLLFMVVIFIGFILRLYKINSPLLDWHSFRQADTASVSFYFLDNGINLLEPKYHDVSRVQSGIFNPEGYRFVELPIFNAIHVVFYKLIGLLSFEIAGRLLSVVFSLITAVFVFKIVTVYFGKTTAFLSMVIFLTLPFNIYFSRVILPEPLAVMTGVVALWFFVKYSHLGGYKNLVTYSVFMALSLLVKPYMIFYNVFPIYYFWKKYGIKKSIIKKEVLSAIVIIFAPFVFWRFWILQHPEGIPFWKWTLNGDGVRFQPAFWYWILGERLGKMILGVWGVYPFVLGLVKSKKSPFLISLTIGALLYVSVFATASVRHDYYQTLIIPVVSMILAVGFSEVCSLKVNKSSTTNNLDKSIKNNCFKCRLSIIFNYLKNIDNLNGKILMLSIFVLMNLVSAFQIKEFYKINHPELMEAGAAVDRLTPKDSLVIASYNGDTAFLYQTKRRGWPVVELPINELINEGAEYYVSVNLNDSQTLEFINKFQILERTSTYVVLKLQ